MLIKRIFDFILALIGLIVSFPVWAIICLLILVKYGRPVFYCQNRVGKNGKLFRSIQFRSMIKEADKGNAHMQSMENDPRVTGLGRFLRKTALDELPQLINIIKGDMSFVGPRALVCVEKEVHDTQERSVFEFPDFKERSKIAPGLTGVAQIFAKRDIPREKKFKYDLWYIKNRSFFLDLYLILLSFIVTFLGEWELRKDKLGFLSKKIRDSLNLEIDSVNK